MKQVIQSFQTGEVAVVDVPTPVLRPQGVLVRTSASLVSAGTERMVVDFAEKNLLQKAQARPDLVRQVLDKAQREGILSTIDSVRNRLGQPLPLGYSSAGTVVAVGAEAGAYRVGDRVACAGGGYACHAEVAYVPRNLAVQIPGNVLFEAAAFTTLGAVALQGIRQAEIVLGHKVLVIGLGLLGQLTVQILKAAGCQVFGVDLDPKRVALAMELGADHASDTNAVVADARAFTRERGFDAVLITADTKSDDPVTLAGELARDRGIVVAVGAVGLEIPRKVYYQKELDLRLSRSYGPGRYDPAYEEKGHDYPYGYVRWTEQRNMQAFVQLLSEGKVDVRPLITHRFAIDEASKAYELITGKTGEQFLGVAITYDAAGRLLSRIDLRVDGSTNGPTHQGQPSIRLGVVGAGNYASATLLPAVHRLQGLDLAGIVSGSGATARASGDRFGFAYCASEMNALLTDQQINWLAILTRHDLHARQAIAGMLAGKDIFVEKPLALNWVELVEVMRAQHKTGRRLLVGFNRRFAPMVQEIQRFLADHRRPLVAICRVNAGTIPATHWTQDPSVGGGRIIGEAIHFVDLLQCLIGAPPTRVYAMAVQPLQQTADDDAILTFTFADGSIGTVVYAAGGDRAFGKERIEVLGDGRIATLDDYRSLELIRDGRRIRRREWLRPDKGHRAEWQELVKIARTGDPSPITPNEIVAAHLAAFAALESLRATLPVEIDAATFWAQVSGE